MKHGPLTRRRMLGLTALGAAGVTAVGAGRGWRAGANSEQSPATPAATPTGGTDLAAFADEIAHGGPEKDGIPPIDAPKFVAADELDQLLKPQDRIFVLDYRGERRVYPQQVLVWHEIVNDVVAGDQLSVTYCPLTGSAVAFTGRGPDGAPLTFGTSGKLVNSNLLMYDRQTDSQWPQILGRAITGALTGTTLTEIPLVWTTWERWRSRGVDAPVLSAETGHIRGYGQDPYGSYAGADQGYYQDDGLFFPVMRRDDRFGPKEIMLGVKVGAERLAIPKQTALAKGVWNLELAGQPIAAVRDGALETVRVFSRRLSTLTLTFQLAEAGALRDQDGRGWRLADEVLTGPNGERLPVVPFYDVMWFAWYAFFPETHVATE